MEDGGLILPSSPHMTASLWRKRPFVQTSRYSNGNTSSVDAVKVRMPPITTVAKGEALRRLSGSKGHSGVQKTRTPLPPFGELILIYFVYLFVD